MVFHDGTFVGPDTTNFFSQTKAVIDAKRHLLEEIADDVTVKNRERIDIYRQLKETTDQATDITTRLVRNIAVCNFLVLNFGPLGAFVVHRSSKDAYL